MIIFMKQGTTAAEIDRINADIVYYNIVPEKSQGSIDYFAHFSH